MDWSLYVRAALARSQPSPDADVVEELSQHAASAFEAARAEGVSTHDAEARVRELVDSWCREPAAHRRRPRRLPVVEPPAASSRGWTGVAQDIRYGGRLLRRQPGFTVLATLLIALGVGTATTLFSLTYVVLLKPLPWPDADRLVSLSEVREGATRQFPNRITNATYLAWDDKPTTIESLASFGEHIYTLTGAGEPERLPTVSATASLFRVLAARPLVGELYTAADQPASRNHVIVLSYGLWQRRFGGSANVIGRTLELSGDAYRIVGVMPRDFVFPTRDVQAWTPAEVPPVVGAGHSPQSRRVSISPAIARLRPGITPTQASAEATARGRAAIDLGMAGTAMFGTQGPPRVTATRYLESLTSDVRPALVILLAAAVLLLVTAVANVAGLQLARATMRRREIALRAALGAGAGRLVRQLLAENLLLGLTGGLGGWALSLAAYRALPHWLPADLPRLDEIAADWRVPVLAVGAALVASVVFGVLPALLTRRLNLVETLSEDSLAPIGGGLRSRLRRTRTFLMAGQVAITVVLLVGASLLGRSFQALLRLDRGYEPRNLLTATLPMYLPGSGTARAQMLDAVVERLEHTPGVLAASGADAMPLVSSRDQLLSFQMPSRSGGGRAMVPVHATVRTVGPGYFVALGMRIGEGRGFTAADSATSLPVVVVNRTFERTYLAGSAVGVRLPVAFNEGGVAWVEIIGVVDDVRPQGLTDPPDPAIFNDYHQLTHGMDVSVPTIAVRTTGDPHEMVGTLRSIVRAQDSSLALDSVLTMDERLLASLARPRLQAALLGVFALFALIVAGVGLFGVLSYNVAQRTREIGVRAALGARPRHLVGLVVRQGLAMTVAGMVVGLGAAIVLAKYAGTLLYGVTTHDPLSFTAVPLVLAVVAIVACYAPARRAARIDPLKALRKS